MLQKRPEDFSKRQPKRLLNPSRRLVKALPKLQKRPEDLSKRRPKRFPEPSRKLVKALPKLQKRLEDGLRKLPRIPLNGQKKPFSRPTDGK